MSISALRMLRQLRLRTRNVSPMTQSGLPSVGALLGPWLKKKRAPKHVFGSPLSNGPMLKSSGLIVHDCPPPKAIDTETDVLQAKWREEISGEERKWNEEPLHTDRKHPSVTGRRWLRSRNRIVKRHDISSGSSDQSSPCVDSGRRTSSRELHGCAIDGELWRRSEHNRLHFVLDRIRTG